MLLGLREAGLPEPFEVDARSDNAVVSRHPLDALVQVHRIAGRGDCLYDSLSHVLVSVVRDLVEDSIVSLPQAVALLRGQLLAAGWSRFLGQIGDAPEDPEPVLLRDRLEFLLDGLPELDPILLHRDRGA